MESCGKYDLGNMETQGEILVDFSTFWDKLIDDLQKSDCYGLNSERKQNLTSSHGSLARVLLLLAVFNPVGPFFRAKSILPYFFSPNQHHQCNSARAARAMYPTHVTKKNSTQQLSFGGVAPRLKTSWFQLHCWLWCEKRNLRWT